MCFIFHEVHFSTMIKTAVIGMGRIKSIVLEDNHQMKLKNIRLFYKSSC